MFVVIQWIKRNLYPIVAILLFGFSFNQILRYQLYQHSFYFNSSVSFFRTVDEWRSNIQHYMGLHDENRFLKEENLRLRKALSLNVSKINGFKDTGYVDSISPSLSKYRVVYTYIPANVIKNTTNARDNFFIIDQGKNQGIQEGMAVIGPTGVVGIILAVSDNYAKGMSILNSKFEITPYIPSLEIRQGAINWPGDNSSEVELKEINRIEKVKLGMEVVTSNYSSIFPANVPIGKIVKIADNKSNFHKITLKLSTDFSRLQTVYCVKNNYQPEIDTLSNPNANMPHP